MKRISFLFFIVPILSYNTKATGQQLQKKVTVPGDTLINKDTLPALKDLKKGFKNLFVDNTLGSDISSQQLNPQAITFVQDYMRKNAKGLKQMKEWGKPYFDLMDEILTQHGLPHQLKYLAVIESGLKYNVISWAGAVGPWALMPATARQYGMTVNRQYDERTDYYKSTHVAARLLKDLFAKYGDWLLVIAAYNGGPGNVNKAITRSGSKDFWILQHHLPNESKNHVKKFISTHYIMEGEGGVTTLTKEEVKDALQNTTSNISKAEMDSSKVVTISGRYNAGVICNYTGMKADDFNRYNPGFNNHIANNGKYDLRMPADKMTIFLAKKFEILNESMQVLLRQAQ